MFRSYVNPTLEQVVNLVLTVPSAITEVHQCLGKCLAALITSIGPELQGKHVLTITLGSILTSNSYNFSFSPIFSHASKLNDASCSMNQLVKL